MLINDFNKYLQMVEENIEYSEGTKEFYRKHLPILDRYFYEKGRNSIEEITLKDVNDFVKFNRKECSETTINKRLGIIKRCIISLKIESEESIKILNLKKLKEVRRSYEMLTQDELKKIVRFVKALPNKTSNYLLYKTFILLLVDTGARPGEVLAIEKRNINLDHNEILLKKTKTKIERFVYFYEDTKECMVELMKINNKSKYLLWNDNKQRAINYDDVRYIMKLIESSTGIKNIYSYMFRHTFATRLIENGADVFAVKDLMGHEKLTTTQIYTHLSKSHVKKVYKASHKR